MLSDDKVTYLVCLSCGAKFYDSVYKSKLQKGSCPKCSKPDFLSVAEFNRRKQFNSDISRCRV